MERAPRKAGERILPARLFTRLIIAGVVIGACTLGVMQYAIAGAHLSDAPARTMGITTFSLASIFFALQTNNDLHSVFSHVTLESHRLLKMSGWSLLAIRLVTVPNFMQRIFGTADLNIGYWVICIVVSSLVLGAGELMKIFRRRAAAASPAEPETESAAQVAA